MRMAVKNLTKGCFILTAIECELVCLYMKVCVGQSNHGGSDEAKCSTVYSSRGNGQNTTRQAWASSAI